MDQNPSQPQVPAGTGLSTVSGVMSQPPISAPAGLAGNPPVSNQAAANSPTSYISGMNEPVTVVPKAPVVGISSMSINSQASVSKPVFSSVPPPVDNTAFLPPTPAGGSIPSHVHQGSKASLYMAVIVIFIATVVALGWIIYSSTQSQSAIMPEVTPSPVAQVTIPAPSVAVGQEDDVEKTSVQSDSDEVIDIEKDVNATDVSTLETDLNLIKTETAQ